MSDRMSGHIYKTEAAAARAGCWFGAIAGNQWAMKANSLPIIRAAGETVNSLGGFLVPSEISTAIVELREIRGVYRRACGGGTPMTRDSVSFRAAPAA